MKYKTTLQTNVNIRVNSIGTLKVKEDRDGTQIHRY